MCGITSLISVLLGFVMFFGVSVAVPVEMSSEALQAESARPVDPVGIAEVGGDVLAQAQPVWAEILTLEGHAGAVHSIDWSPQGTRLVSGGADGTIRIWDAVTGAELKVMCGHEGDVWAVAWTPDGTRIASGGEDGTVRVWAPLDGTQLWLTQPGDTWVSDVDWSPDSTTIASAHGDGVVYGWANPDMIHFQLRGHEYSVNAVAWENVASVISGGGSGYPDNTVRQWSTSWGNRWKTMWGHRGEVWTVAVKNGLIASGSTDHTVRIWGAGDGAALAVLEGHTSTVTSVDWDFTGQYIVSASGDGSLRIWDQFTQQATATIFNAHGGRWINDAAWATDGRIASAGADGAIRIWSASQ